MADRNTRPSRYKPQTLEQAKAAYRRHGPRMSSQELRRLERGAELLERAERIHEAEERKRVAKRKRVEKAARDRAARLRQGLPSQEPPRVSASQTLLTGFTRHAAGPAAREVIVISDDEPGEGADPGWRTGGKGQRAPGPCASSYDDEEINDTALMAAAATTGDDSSGEEDDSSDEGEDGDGGSDSENDDDDDSGEDDRLWLEGAVRAGESREGVAGSPHPGWHSSASSGPERLQQAALAGPARARLALLVALEAADLREVLAGRRPSGRYEDEEENEDEDEEDVGRDPGTHRSHLEGAVHTPTSTAAVNTVDPVADFLGALSTQDVSFSTGDLEELGAAPPAEGGRRRRQQQEG